MEKNKVKLSIIVPIYKTERYLVQCVESILTQRFTDYELILVDDGSPDGSAGICDEYAMRNEKIRVVHKKMVDLSVLELQDSRWRRESISAMLIQMIGLTAITFLT